ncbi:MAG: PIN domain-containing protein [Elusimicrobia bacterium]|nr:PIN domain-containing protein [Elusimicrobiota bacterium]MBU2615228.1 PIN domain-containing protein [Elusimicrobiota bacterium]
MYCIDASVIVNSFFPKESNYQFSSKLIKTIRISQTAVYLPEIILPEISSAIARGTNDSELAIEFVEQILAIPTFNFIPVERDISFLAAEIASKYRLWPGEDNHE